MEATPGKDARPVQAAHACGHDVFVALQATTSPTRLERLKTRKEEPFLTYNVQVRGSDREAMRSNASLLKKLLEKSKVWDFSTIMDGFKQWDNFHKGGITRGKKDGYASDQCQIIKIMMGEALKAKRNCKSGVRQEAWLQDICAVIKDDRLERCRSGEFDGQQIVPFAAAESTSADVAAGPLCPCGADSQAALAAQDDVGVS